MMTIFALPKHKVRTGDDIHAGAGIDYSAFDRQKAQELLRPNTEYTVLLSFVYLGKCIGRVSLEEVTGYFGHFHFFDVIPQAEEDSKKHPAYKACR